MRAETANRLMESIAANRLTILCGAGLSMAPPSSVPSAAAIATECAQRYQRRVGSALPPEASADLEAMSRWFREHNTFGDLFIHTLVPWEQFNTSPNAGHEAIADFLACGAVISATTTNYDQLVEQAARLLGEPDFQPIIDAADLSRTFEHNPFLKVHGCCVNGPTRLATIWCKEQLDEDSTRSRMTHFRDWLRTNLLDRDVLIIGFWSDWAYLTEIFTTSIDAIGPRSVFLIDPSPAAALQAKAPAMWDWAHRTGIAFFHEQESGAAFLESFREHFSRTFLRHLLVEADATYKALFAESCDDMDSRHSALALRDLYALRRDLTGAPRTQPVRAKSPQLEHRVVSALHMRLLALGAHYEHHTYRFRDRVLRLVNAGGQLLSEVKQRFRLEPPLHPFVHQVICVGATPDEAPADIIRDASGPSIIRPGSTGEWITADAFLNELREAGHG